MDYKQIQELIKLVNKSNIGELSIEEDDFRLVIKQKKEFIQSNISSQGSAPVIMPVPQSMLTQAPPAAATPVQQSSTAGKKDNLLTVKSPMIGTFYRRPSPDKPYFVEVGDDITPGQVICVIEAMKLFNEIENEVSGRIVKILVDDASPVEYDQPLFLVEPV